MNPTPYVQHKWAKEKWKYSPVHSKGERTLETTLCPDSSPGTSQGVSVLFTFRSTKRNQLCLLCSLTQLFPHLCNKAQSPKLIQILLAICGLLQPNQSWYTILLPVSNQITVTQQQKKTPQDLLLKTKVSSRVCRDLLPLSSPALDHKAQSLVFTFKPSNAMSIGLVFNSHKVRMSVANRKKLKTEKENFKKLKGKQNTSFQLKLPQLPLASRIL